MEYRIFMSKLISRKKFKNESKKKSLFVNIKFIVYDISV